MSKTDRIQSEIMKRLSVLRKDSVRVPRVVGCIIGITDVKVDSELSRALISVSVYGGDGEQAVQGLNHSAGFLRSRLKELIDMRTMPALVFVLDRGAEYAAEIEAIIKSIRKDS